MICKFCKNEMINRSYNYSNLNEKCFICKNHGGHTVTFATNTWSFQSNYKEKLFWIWIKPTETVVEIFVDSASPGYDVITKLPPNIEITPTNLTQLDRLLSLLVFT